MSAVMETKTVAKTQNAETVATPTAITLIEAITQALKAPAGGEAPPDYGL